MHGIVIPLDPVIFHLGPLALRWYGLMIGIGILVGIWIDARDAERTGIGRDHIYNIATWFVIGGIIGGRLYYVVQNDLGSYLAHPEHILATWEGGMAFYGVFITCVPIAIWYTLRHRLPFWTLADTVILGLPLGQAFGRVGNIVNGDIVGYQTNSAFAFIYTNPNSFAPALDTPFVPANLYELLVSLGIFGILWWARTRIRIPGMLFILYLYLYAISQFVIFFWRNNSITLFRLKQAQLTSLVVMLLLLPVASYLWQRWKRTHPGEPAMQKPTSPQFRHEQAPPHAQPPPA